MAETPPYRDPEITVRSVVGISSPLLASAGIHKGRALAPLLNVLFVDTVTQGIQCTTPFTLFYADDVYLVSRNKAELVKKWIDRRMLQDLIDWIWMEKDRQPTITKQANQCCPPRWTTLSCISGWYDWLWFKMISAPPVPRLLYLFISHRIFRSHCFASKCKI